MIAKFKVPLYSFCFLKESILLIEINLFPYDFSSGQSEEVPAQVREMVLEYIRNENCLILAVLQQILIWLIRMH